MGKVAGSVSIIGGADGPTSIFIAGKGGKVKLTTRIQNYFRKMKRGRIKKRITANPHTLEEVVEWLKREYGAVEVSQQSHNYLEQRNSLKASLIIRHRPDLLGELMDLEPYRLGLFKDMTIGQRSGFMKIMALDVVGIGAVLYWIIGLGTEENNSGSILPLVIYILTVQMKRKFRPEFEGTESSEEEPMEESTQEEPLTVEEKEKEN